MTLPPLPEDRRHSYDAAYSASQMQAYAQAAVLAEREACAALCDTRSADHWHDYKSGPTGVKGSARAEYASDEADACAAAIRARGE